MAFYAGSCLLLLGLFALVKGGMAYVDTQRVGHLLATPILPIARTPVGKTVQIAGRIRAPADGALVVPGTERKAVWFSLRVQNRDKLDGRGGIGGGMSAWRDAWTQSGACQFFVDDASGDSVIVQPEGATVIAAEAELPESEQSVELLRSLGSLGAGEVGGRRILATVLAPGDEVRAVGPAESQAGPSGVYRDAVGDRAPLTLAQRAGRRGQLILFTGSEDLVEARRDFVPLLMMVGVACTGLGLFLVSR